MRPPNRRERQRISQESAAVWLRWLSIAKEGATRNYHTGYLGHDREIDFSVQLIAALLAEAAGLGLVRLTQRRVMAAYQYMATRTLRPLKGEARRILTATLKQELTREGNWTTPASPLGTTGREIGSGTSGRGPIT